MPSIGADAEILLDGTGYYVEPGSYHMQQPRIRKATIRADGNEAYVDLGPGKRVWSMVILCINNLTKYDGTSTNTSGQSYRDALRNSFINSTGTTIAYSDPINTGGNVAVHFDSYAETILDIRSQIISLAGGGSIGASYKVAIVLTEA